MGRVTGAIRGADLHFEGREFEGSCEDFQLSIV